MKFTSTKKVPQENSAGLFCFLKMRIKHFLHSFRIQTPTSYQSKDGVTSTIAGFLSMLQWRLRAQKSGPETAFFHYGARSSVSLSLLSYVTPEDPERSELELRLKRKWKDGTESLIFTQKAKKFDCRRASGITCASSSSSSSSSSVV
jgi:hypothetical protein